MPFIRYLSFDDVRTQVRVTIDPALEQILRCMDAFDPEHVQMITLSERPPDANAELPFGGRGCVIGKAYESDHFTVDIFDPEQNTEFSLIDEERIGTESALRERGQATGVPGSALIAPQWAKEVVRQFFEDGKMLEGTIWGVSRIW